MTDLTTNAWVRNPRLYELAKEAAKETPPGSLRHHQTLKAYLKLGGKLEADEEAKDT